MPRRPRIHLPGVPIHLVQRGHNRDACFFTDEDFLAYREWLGEALKKSGCALHAYVFMTNHVHLLLTPESVASLGGLMKALGQRYVQYVNRTYRRSGTLWEGRFRSCLMQGETYVLGCYRYVELNPVRAGMVDQFRQATNGNFALGGSRFIAEIEQAMGRRVTRGKPGGRSNHNPPLRRCDCRGLRPRNDKMDRHCEPKAKQSPGCHDLRSRNDEGGCGSRDDDRRKSLWDGMRVHGPCAVLAAPKQAARSDSRRSNF